MLIARAASLGGSNYLSVYVSLESTTMGLTALIVIPPA